MTVPVVQGQSAIHFRTTLGGGLGRLIVVYQLGTLDGRPQRAIVPNHGYPWFSLRSCQQTRRNAKRCLGKSKLTLTDPRITTVWKRGGCCYLREQILSNYRSVLEGVGCPRDQSVLTPGLERAKNNPC